MKRGGYKIIDFGNSKIGSETGGHIDGIYNELESSIGRKALLFSGVNDNGDIVADFYSIPYVVSTIFYIPMSVVYTDSESIVTKLVKVESDDDISIVEATIEVAEETKKIKRK